MRRWPNSYCAIFPRSKERGLIEAGGVHDVLHSVQVFPRSKERGLIEADGDSDTVADCITFPRSKERGLIEAMRVMQHSAQQQQLSAFERARPQ